MYFLALLIFTAMGWAGVVHEAPPVVRVFEIPDGWRMQRWAFNGATVVSDEESVEGQPVLRTWRLADNKTEQTELGEGQWASYLHFASMEELLYVGGETRLVVARLPGLEVVAEVSPDGKSGIGLVRYARGAVWFHTLSEHRHDADLRMFRLTINSMKLEPLGEGYYPYPLADNGFLYINRNESELYFAKSIAAGDTDARRAAKGPLFFPTYIGEKNVIVAQWGFEPASVVLMDGDGSYIRGLSPKDAHCVGPRVSPSGHFVAYYTHGVDGNSETRVEVVDFRGLRSYSRRIANRGAAGAYCWATEADLLAVVVDLGDGRRTLETERFSPR